MKGKFIFLFLLFSIINYCLSEEQTIFTVSVIDSDEAKCIPQEKKYSFDILGSVKDSCMDADSFYIDLIDKENGAQCKLICDSDNNAKLSCYINIETYKLEGKKVVIKSTPPESEKITFDNWEDFMSDEGNSTIGESITCKPLEPGTLNFVAKNISFEGGCIGTNISSTISASSDSEIVENINFDLPLSMPENKIANCIVPKNKNEQINIFCNVDASNALILLKNFDGYDYTGNYHIILTVNDVVRGKAPNCNQSSFLMMKSLLLICFLALIL